MAIKGGGTKRNVLSNFSLGHECFGHMTDFWRRFFYILSKNSFIPVPESPWIMTHKKESIDDEDLVNILLDDSGLGSQETWVCLN